MQFAFDTLSKSRNDTSHRHGYGECKQKRITKQRQQNYCSRSTAICRIAILLMNTHSKLHTSPQIVGLLQKTDLFEARLRRHCCSTDARLLKTFKLRFDLWSASGEKSCPEAILMDLRKSRNAEKCADNCGQINSTPPHNYVSRTLQRVNEVM